MLLPPIIRNLPLLLDHDPWFAGNKKYLSSDSPVSSPSPACLVSFWIDHSEDISSLNPILEQAAVKIPYFASITGLLWTAWKCSDQNDPSSIFDHIPWLDLENLLQIHHLYIRCVARLEWQRYSRNEMVHFDHLPFSATRGSLHIPLESFVQLMCGKLVDEPCITTRHYCIEWPIKIVYVGPHLRPHALYMNSLRPVLDFYKSSPPQKLKDHLIALGLGPLVNRSLSEDIHLLYSRKSACIRDIIAFTHIHCLYLGEAYRVNDFGKQIPKNNVVENTARIAVYMYTTIGTECMLSLASFLDEIVDHLDDQHNYPLVSSLSQEIKNLCNGTYSSPCRSVGLIVDTH